MFIYGINSNIDYLKTRGLNYVDGELGPMDINGEFQCC